MSDANSTHKKCTSCGETKSVLDFYKHATITGAYAARCKRCARAATMESRAKKRDELLERQRIHQRNFSPEVRKRRIEKRTQYRAEYPERYAAAQALNVATRSGKIVPQPCFVCGEKAEAHHPDYSRPLDVVWLCQPHHREAHAIVKRPGPKPQRPIV
jgi:hypothetical protein